MTTVLAAMILVGFVVALIAADRYAVRRERRETKLAQDRAVNDFAEFLDTVTAADFANIH